MGECRDDAISVFKLRHKQADDSQTFLLQLLFPIAWSLSRSPALALALGLAFALVAAFGCTTFVDEGFLLFRGKQLEVRIIKAMGVMVFNLFSICQSDGPRLETLGFVVLMFAILVLLSSRLFNLPHVFAFIIAVRVPSSDILFNISHGLHVGAIWPIFHPRDDDWMNVIQVWVPDPFEQATDLCFFWGGFPTFPSHDGMCVVKQ